jgi:TetR/AcrR family transcriptional regulator
MVTAQSSTEEKILEAAKTVFHRKGFDGARMQEIANEAGINKSLLHYYYRSKENLFDAVFKDAFNELFKKIFTVVGSTIPFEEKIRFILSDYIGFMQKNPYIPSFILNEINHNPARITGLLKDLPIPPAEIFSRVKKSLEDEGITSIDHRQFVINLIALSVFPIIARPLIKTILNLTEEEYSEFIETRKKELPDFIFKAIRS